jgi:phage recombination protein Bet
MTDGKLKLTPEEIDTIRSEILEPAKGAKPTEGEVALFVHQCERTGLNPFDRQIYARFNWDKDANRQRMQAQSTIDGFRAVAERTGKYLGQKGPFWTKTGEWADVWLADEAPKAAKVGVWKQGAKEPTWGVAKFSEYAQKTRGGALTRMWQTMPSNQLAKCAEALALRKAFPNELSGIYTTDEMEQADTPTEATATEARGTLAGGETGTGTPPPTPAGAQVPSALEPPEKPNGRDPNRVKIPPGTLPPERPVEVTAERKPEPPLEVEKPPARDGSAPASAEELDALRDLIKAVGVSEPYIRMVLIEFGLEDVDTVENMLPKLTVSQALHVMSRVNERAGVSS